MNVAVLSANIGKSTALTGTSLLSSRDAEVGFLGCRGGFAQKTLASSAERLKRRLPNVTASASIVPPVTKLRRGPAVATAEA
jgi:hypothetical protein